MNTKADREEALPVANGQWKGFGSKILLSAFGILFTALVMYFAWLGSAVIQIRIDAAETRRDVRSLLETRTNAEVGAIAKTDERLGKLEERADDRGN